MRVPLAIAALVLGPTGCHAANTDPGHEDAGGAAGAATSPKAPVLSCGTVDPHLAVACNDGDPEANVPTTKAGSIDLAEGPDGVADSLSTQCNLGLVGNDMGFHVRADVSATCVHTSARDDAVMVQVFSLSASVDRKCGTGPHGSSALAQPVWTASLALPDDGGTYKVVVGAMADQNLSVPCHLRIGGVDADPILGNSPPILAAFFAAGQTLPIVLDCTAQPAGPGTAGFALIGCYGASDTNVPPRHDMSTSLVLTVRAGRCPEACP